MDRITKILLFAIIVVGVLYIYLQYFPYVFAPQNNEYIENNTNISPQPQCTNSANNVLAIKLFNRVNNIFSPLSISFSLSLLHLYSISGTDDQFVQVFGCKYTLEQLKNIYNLFNNDTIKLVNILLINEGYKVNMDYLNSIRPMTLIEYINFSDRSVTTAKVNNYVDQNTNGLIKNIVTVDELDSSSTMILLNAIYYKNEWLYKFESGNTKPMKFIGSNKMADMMYQENSFMYFEDKNVQHIEIPYKNKNYIMGILLPNIGVNSIEEETGMTLGKEITDSRNVGKITGDEFNKNINFMQATDIRLYIPKFIQRNKLKLIPLLTQLGMTDLFNNNATLGIGENIRVSDVIHEAVIIVNESGTEAAAATAVVMQESYMMQTSQKKSIVFLANRPFNYYIRYVPDNIVLFCGSYYG